MAGTSVSGVAMALCQEYPSLRDHLFHDNGMVKEHFMLIVKGQLATPETAVGADAVVEIMLATSGGAPVVGEAGLSEAERRRYARHLMLPQVGEAGQARLQAARVLVVGAGGLGSPIAMYLAAAGVGTLGLVDFDVVDESNLQRQIVHATGRVGQPKVESAQGRLHEINPHVQIQCWPVALDEHNARDLVGRYDVVVDGCDNYKTRYIVNRACMERGVPYVYGSIYQFDGQAAVFLPDSGPCYECIYPKEPPPELAPNAGNKGVFGVLPGVIGVVEATETLKLLLGLGVPLAGRMLMYDALKMNFRDIAIRPRPGCPACTLRRENAAG